MSAHKTRIAGAFSAAAPGYEAAARVQSRVAAQVARRLPVLPPSARVLDVGCGTGLLTRHILAALPDDGRVTAADISPAMAAEAGRRITDQRVSFAVMDGENPVATDDGYDLIASSLAAQWFHDLPAALGRLAGLLRPGGTLVLATLGERTFAEWRAAHAGLGLTPGTADYPGPEALAAMLPGASVERWAFTENYENGRDFLGSVAALGAATPRPGHRPLGAGSLRRVMKEVGSPCLITWDILVLTYITRREGR